MEFWIIDLFFFFIKNRVSKRSVLKTFPNRPTKTEFQKVLKHRLSLLPRPEFRSLRKSQSDWTSLTDIKRQDTKRLIRRTQRSVHTRVSHSQSFRYCRNVSVKQCDRGFNGWQWRGWSIRRKQDGLSVVYLGGVKMTKRSYLRPYSTVCPFSVKFHTFIHGKKFGLITPDLIKIWKILIKEFYFV